MHTLRKTFVSRVIFLYMANVCDAAGNGMVARWFTENRGDDIVEEVLYELWQQILQGRM